MVGGCEMTTTTATHTRDVPETTLPDWETVKSNADAFIRKSNHYWSDPMRRRLIQRLSRSYRAFVESLVDPRMPHDKSWHEDPTGEEAVRNVMKGLSI